MIIAYSRSMRTTKNMAIVQADFDRIALHSSRDSDEHWNHNNHYHQFLLDHVPAGCKSALDLGCGTGAFARLLAQRAEHVLALDLSPQMIHQAQTRSADAPNIDFQVADVFVWECSPEQFDYIVSIAALHHLPLEEVLSKLKRWLAPSGSLVILDIYQTRFSDLFVNLVAVPVNWFMQLLKNGHRPPVSPEERAAMAEHMAHDSYLTLAQVRHLAQAMLPGARVRRHLFWRYSLVWKAESRMGAYKRNGKEQDC
jgi:2-polyprenyl-3-methyl-5-hydroxy-6-metoxy-1,4-benzoquinol methylase